MFIFHGSINIGSLKGDQHLLFINFEEDRQTKHQCQHHRNYCQQLQEEPFLPERTGLGINYIIRFPGTGPGRTSSFFCVYRLLLIGFDQFFHDVAEPIGAVRYGNLLQSHMHLFIAVLVI